MNLRRFFQLVLLSVLPVTTFAQNSGSGETEMADLMRSDGKIFVVVTVVSIVFAGIVVYLILLDRKIRRLEQTKTGN